MAFDNSKPFSYGIPDGDYKGEPTSGTFYEKDGRLLLAVNFAVKDPASGEFYKNDRGYPWEAKKVFFLTTKDGALNQATIDGLREWAHGWSFVGLESFDWFNAENLRAVGEVRLSFATKAPYGQSLFVHDPNKQRERKAFVPEGAVTDKATLMAKWGAKFRAAAAATPKKVAPVVTSPAPAPAPAAMPKRTPAAAPKAEEPPPTAQDVPPWETWGETANGAYNYFLSLFGTNDDKWFAIQDAAIADKGKDPGEWTPDELHAVYNAISKANADKAALAPEDTFPL